MKLKIIVGSTIVGIILFIGLFFLFSTYLPNKAYTSFAIKSFPAINTEDIEKIECEYPSPQFPDPSIKCTLKISKDNLSLRDVNIEEIPLNECDSSDFDLRKQGSLIMCGYLTNVDNGYDMSAVTVRDLGGNYVIFISAFDY